MDIQAGKLKKRPPVVVVMGHIDHGKTTLLDRIRKTSVAAKETGGITQHIGAYEITVQHGQHGRERITFIDTPGHEAFSQMRARGAKIADVAILVVAADDGVKPQTKEALGTIQLSQVPFLVAINKIDKSNADPNKVKSELAEIGVLVEGWGGSIPVAEISAKESKGLDHLLDLILLLAELEDLKGDESLPAKGVIIEAHRDHQRGATATFLIKDGILKRGDCIVYGGKFGVIKILEDFSGEPVEKAAFSSPVVIAGLSHLPNVGDEFHTCATRDEAEVIAKEKSVQGGEDVSGVVSQGSKLTLQLILKADVAGSLEAMEESLLALSNSEVAINVLKKDVGPITESDIKLTQTSSGTIVVGFRVKIDFSAATLLLRHIDTVTITGGIIYEIIDQVQEEISKRLKLVEAESPVAARVKIIHIFRNKESTQVVGGKVYGGFVRVGQKVRVVRLQEQKGEAVIENLKHGKEDVREVEDGLDCGLELKGQSGVTVEVDDILEVLSK